MCHLQHCHASTVMRLCRRHWLEMSPLTGKSRFVLEFYQTIESWYGWSCLKRHTTSAMTRRGHSCRSMGWAASTKTRRRMHASWKKRKHANKRKFSRSFTWGTVAKRWASPVSRGDVAPSPTSARSTSSRVSGWASNATSRWARTMAASLASGTLSAFPSTAASCAPLTSPLGTSHQRATARTVATM